MTALLLLSVASSLCTGVVAGVFFAFSVFVIRALAQLPPEQGIAAMQRINVTVITPLFLGTFLGTVPLLAAAAYAAYRATSGATAWLAIAFVVYALGSVGVTIAFNVPRNNRLAALEATSNEATDYWPRYVEEWLLWNHVRCLASALAAVASAVAAGK